ncbi:hypothetical protein SDJN02_02749, partial [Cucurbita argyrosperma subsp. argyrosperma]
MTDLSRKKSILESEPEFYSKHVKIQNTKYPEQTYIRISGLPSQNLVAHHNKDPRKREKETVIGARIFANLEDETF